MQIRPEQASDVEAIHRLNGAAFETDAEAKLVDRLRTGAQPFLSLVATENNSIVGHILFTPVSAEKESGARILGLAPMAVNPQRQNQGIGSALVLAGLDAARELGYQAVVVLGHPAFYPRFGFKPADSFHIHSEYEVPADVFMALELEPGSLAKTTGLVKYHPAFAELE